MNIKDLLKPRFELIADYPGNSQPIGNVTIEDATASYFRKFKANFYELEWYEKRDYSDLPLFVKTTYNGTVNKVDNYNFENDTIKVQYPEGICQFSLKAYLSERLPAIEEEYLQNIVQLEALSK